MTMADGRVFLLGSQLSVIIKLDTGLRCFILPSKETLRDAILELGMQTGEVAPVILEMDSLSTVLGGHLYGSNTNMKRLLRKLRGWEQQ